MEARLSRRPFVTQEIEEGVAWTGIRNAENCAATKLTLLTGRQVNAQTSGERWVGKQPSRPDFRNGRPLGDGGFYRGPRRERFGREPLANQVEALLHYGSTEVKQ